MSWLTASPTKDTAPQIRAVRSDPPADAQEIWFALQRDRWRSLALVAADAQCDTAAVAAALVEVGTRTRAQPVLLLSGAALDLERSATLTAHLAHRQSEEPVIVALGPLDAFPSGVAVARAADKVVLCARRGFSKLQALRAAVALVGREKFLGYVVIDGKARR